MMLESEIARMNDDAERLSSIDAVLEEMAKEMQAVYEICFRYVHYRRILLPVRDETLTVAVHITPGHERPDGTPLPFGVFGVGAMVTEPATAQLIRHSKIYEISLPEGIAKLPSLIDDVLREIEFAT